MTKRVLITGASGVLGSAVYDAFRAGPHTVLGLAHSRAVGNLVRADLTQADDTRRVLEEFKPDWVVHCAAERRPDVAEKDPEGVTKLNVDVPRQLAMLAKDLHFTLVYISTDYVFDGSSPPYHPWSEPNPLQLYGKSKRDGEIAVLSVDSATVIVLRVPVLYGPAPKNSDSAVNILLDVVEDQSGKKYKMDHYATRYPTNVLDIASFLVRLSDLDKPLPRIIHYSAPEPFTKYEMCLIFAKILGLPHQHIVPDDSPPSGATPRPRDCHLSTKETEELGVEGGLGCRKFEEWWIGYLNAVQ
ncbi:hypothetical protein EDD17DRAFT_1882790 [Pisolithus thermaeus]|nr:hypothetical protein EV401DRAFT_2002047 [Pisolithus croceorrhizus]KAI6168578.1 hypothetical protein EDD17DRAFT_1882790 [Pisolithus thermaeus]